MLITNSIHSQSCKNNIKCGNEHYGLEDEDISRPTNYKHVMQNQ